MKHIILFLTIFMPLFTYAQSPVLFGDSLEGIGVKMMWIPEKAAFRAGELNALHPTYWDLDSIGVNSFASGLNTKASGPYSTAMGEGTTASGPHSTAMGLLTTASGQRSTAMGQRSTASGLISTAMGFSTEASGPYSTAMGYRTIASGLSSTAIGFLVSTDGHEGALIIGDSDPLDQGSTLVGRADEFVARFRNGYYFLTSGDDVRMGIKAGPGANAWSSISDVNRKENFQFLEDQEVLEKLSSIEYTSWNYKGQDPGTFRHYGIMAQEFYNLFGQDDYGTIGVDTLVNPIDMMGIVMSAIKGAKLEIEELKEENTRLRDFNSNLEKRMLAIEELLAIKNEIAIARVEE